MGCTDVKFIGRNQKNDKHTHTVVKMSPVSLVFRTAVTVRIGHKTQLELEHPFQNIRCIVIRYQCIPNFNISPDSWAVTLLLSVDIVCVGTYW